MSPVVHILSLLLIFGNCSVSFTEDISSTWNKFWSISCEFSGIVSRTRRSVHADPDFNNPIELFDYFYPLADVKLEDFMADEQRSSHSFSTWMEDAMYLWESECHSRSRREKRASEDASDDSSPYSGDEYDDFTGDKKQSTGNGTTKVVAAPAIEKKAKKVVADADTFFTQYGGDIEYFFPLLSFGIPFDGEITFLGFHGFKGLFPYK